MRKDSLDMNLNETIISSFFGHLILLLLMMAVSDYMTHVPWDIQKIVSVDLEREDSYVSPAAGTDSKEVPTLDSSLPDQAAGNPPKESKQIPEPEKKAEAPPEPAKIEEAEKPPVAKEGFTSLEAYHQFIMLHRQIFRQQAGARVNELLGGALRVNKREFYGGTAIVSLKFGPDRKLDEVLVDSASPELKAFLEEFSWDAIPAPATYSLGNTGVQIEFSVLEGYMSFNVSAI
jgi:hypothetical protein